jgi:hypothetical protein
MQQIVQIVILGTHEDWIHVLGELQNFLRSLEFRTL